MNFMSEKIEAGRDGARLHRNSGRGWIEKGDATLGPFVIDYKEYTESFGVSRKVWAKATLDALKARKQPALRLVLGKTGETPLRVWVIGDTMFQEMLEAWTEKYGDEV
jgi:hypothetical protein